MNIQEYISSGVVELYVSGALCEEDAREFEALAEQYPELKLEQAQVEEALELYALRHQLQPDPSLKDKVLAGINKPYVVAAAAVEQTNTASSDTSILDMPVQRNYSWYAAAASILVVLFAGFSLYLYQKNTEQASQMAALKSDMIRQENLVAGILRDPHNQTVMIKGSEKLPQKMPQAAVKIFWNKDTQEVKLSVVNLPPLKDDEQYQLWALKNDQPIDAGVFEAESANLIQVLKKIQSADNWAVTIEPKGGSAQPHLEKLCMMAVQS